LYTLALGVVDVVWTKISTGTIYKLSYDVFFWTPNDTIFKIWSCKMLLFEYRVKKEKIMLKVSIYYATVNGAAKLNGFRLQYRPRYNWNVIFRTKFHRQNEK